MDNLDTLQSWDLVKTEILKAEDSYVPKKRRRVKCRPLWMQQNIIRTIRKKRRLWATYKKSREYEEYLAYKRVENETKKLVRQAKETLNGNLLERQKRNLRLQTGQVLAR